MEAIDSYLSFIGPHRNTLYLILNGLFNNWLFSLLTYFVFPTEKLALKTGNFETFKNSGGHFVLTKKKSALLEAWGKDKICNDLFLRIQAIHFSVEYHIVNSE